MRVTADRDVSKFVIDFGGIKVPSTLAKELESSVQELALAILAKIDYRGGLHIGHLPPGMYGYVMEPWGSGTPTDGGQPELDVQSHTTIIRTLMERPLPVLRQVARDPKQRRKPSGTEVLEALAQLPKLPAPTRASIEATLRVLKTLEAQQLSPEAQSATDEINGQIDSARDLDDLLALIRKLLGLDRASVGGASEGLRVAQRIIEDGRASIYSPDLPFYADVGGGDPIVVYSVAKEDAKGAVGGAVAGFGAGVAVGGLGAGPGAVAGGVAGAAGASAAEVVSMIWDWLF